MRKLHWVRSLPVTQFRTSGSCSVDSTLALLPPAPLILFCTDLDGMVVKKNKPNQTQSPGYARAVVRLYY